MDIQLQDIQTGENLNPVTHIDNVRGFDSDKIINTLSTPIEESFMTSPLKELIAQAKQVNVNSQEVTHEYTVDNTYEPICTRSIMQENGQIKRPIPLYSYDQKKFKLYDLVLVPGVDGYDESGQSRILGSNIILMIVDHESASGNPIAIALNGKKDNPNDTECIFPGINQGAKLKIIGNAFSETQDDFRIISNETKKVYLQKQPSNIQFLLGEKSKAQVNISNLEGEQVIYTTEGLRQQCNRGIVLSDKLTIQKILAISKLFFACTENKNAVLLAGSTLIEQFQNIDYSNHPEISFISRTDLSGLVVTNIHTIFGDIEIKYEPSFDQVGIYESGILFNKEDLIHYVYQDSNTVYEALVLNGTHNIWLSSDFYESSDIINIEFWDSLEEPTTKYHASESRVYLLQSCPGISTESNAGQVWEHDYDGWKNIDILSRKKVQ